MKNEDEPEARRLHIAKENEGTNLDATFTVKKEGQST